MENDKIVINERFIEVSKSLIFQNIVKNDKDFAIKLGIHPQSFTDIKYNRRGVTVEMIRDLRIIFNISPNWIIFGSGDMYITDSIVEKSDLNVKGNVNLNAFSVSKSGLNEQKSAPIPAQYVQNETPQNNMASETSSHYTAITIENEEQLQKIIAMANEISSLKTLIEALKSQIESLKEIEKLRNLNEELQKRLNSAKKSA